MDLPFTNIRQVLSLHNKVSPEKIFLTVISDQGREELSYAEFSARSHQTANFLQEDLGIQPGDIITIYDDYPANTAVLLMSCWLVGAVVAFGVTQDDLNNKLIKTQFVRHENFSEIVKKEELKSNPFVQLGGIPTEGFPHFDTLVRSMPNSFFNDHTEPTLDTLAFQTIWHDPNWGPINAKTTVTQGELLTAAKKLADSQAITGNQRLIGYFYLSEHMTPEESLNRMSSFIGVLLVGASLIINTIFEPFAFWHEVAASRLHIACLSTTHLQQLITFANEQKAAGKPIYGEGIYQQDIKQFRHIYCPDAKGQDDLIKQFTDMFPFPVITGA